MNSHLSHTDPVTLFGLIFVLAIAASWWLARRNASAVAIHPSHIDLLLPLSIVFGIAGGMLLSMLMPGDRLLAGEAMQVGVRVRLFGLVAGGAIVLFVYSRLNALSFRSLLDAFALPSVIGLAIHRIGCFYAGCCWGDVSVHDSWLTSAEAADIGVQIQTLPWLAGEWVLTGVQYGPGSHPYAQQLALGLIGADALKSLPVHPVQLYEAVLLVIAYLLLRRVPLDKQQPGTIAVATAIAYAVIRFAMEYLRADGSLAAGNLTVTQLQCIALFAVTLLVSYQAKRIAGARIVRQ